MKYEEKLARYWDTENKNTSNKPDYLHYILFNKLCQDIGSIEGKKILDIGCGHADLLLMLRGLGANVTGTDISEESLAVCRKQGLTVVNSDCRQLKFPDNSFDVVYSMGVVEHVHETKKAIAEHFRVCKPNGMVVVMVPNRLTPYFLLGYLYYLINGNFKYGLLATKGKSYSANSFRQLFEYPAEITPFYGSAILKETTKTMNKSLADKIEMSFIGKKLGHLLYAKSIKPTE